MVFSYIGGMRIGETGVSFGDDLKPRQSPLAVYFTAERCDSMVDTNTCIANLVKDYPGPHLPWGGPVVVMTGVDDDVSNFCDIDESDVDDIRGFCGRFQ